MNLFHETLLELCGCKIWPPTHDDPRVKGPQPRILTKQQWDAMEKMRKEKCEPKTICRHGGDGSGKKWDVTR